MITELVHRHYRGMPQLCGIAGLPEKTVPVIVGGEITDSQNLERDDPVKLGVAGLVHRSESARADLGDQLESACVTSATPWPPGAVDPASSRKVEPQDGHTASAVSVCSSTSIGLWQ